MDRGVNALAFGMQGTGKTHAMCAIGHRLVESSRSVLFIPAYRLVQDMLAANRDLELPRMLRKLDNFDLLVIDDLGYLPQGVQESEVLFTLIAERYERRSLGITSNLVFSEWEKVFANPMATAAAIDRIVHHSVILEFVHAKPNHADGVEIGRQVGTPGTHQVQNHAVLRQRLREITSYRGDGPVIYMHNQARLHIEEPIIGLVHATKELGRVCRCIIHKRPGQHTGNGVLAERRTVSSVLSQRAKAPDTVTRRSRNTASCISKLRLQLGNSIDTVPDNSINFMIIGYYSIKLIITRYRYGPK